MMSISNYREAELLKFIRVEYLLILGIKLIVGTFINYDFIILGKKECGDILIRFYLYYLQKIERGNIH